MAQKIIALKTCDIAGDDVAATASFSFGYEGENYIIDLSEEYAKQFTEELGYWAENARKDTVAKAPGTRVRAPKVKVPSSDRTPASETAEMRAWAKQNGFPELGDRGRVPQIVRDAFYAAQDS